MLHQMTLSFVTFQAPRARILVLLPVFFEATCRALDALSLVVVFVLVLAATSHHDTVVRTRFRTFVFKINPRAYKVSVGRIEQLHAFADTSPHFARARAI